MVLLSRRWLMLPKWRQNRSLMSNFRHETLRICSLTHSNCRSGILLTYNCIILMHFSSTFFALQAVSTSVGGGRGNLNKFNSIRIISITIWRAESWRKFSSNELLTRQRRSCKLLALRPTTNHDEHTKWQWLVCSCTLGSVHWLWSRVETHITSCLHVLLRWMRWIKKFSNYTYSTRGTKWERASAVMVVEPIIVHANQAHYISQVESYKLFEAKHNGNITAKLFP